MFGYSPHTVDLLHPVYLKSLYARVVLDVPHFDDTFGVCRNKLAKCRQAVDAHEWVLMLIQLDDKLFKVGIPDVNSEVETHTDNDFVDFAVGELSDSPGVPTQDFARLFSVVVENLWLELLVLEEFLEDFLLFLRLLQIDFVFL